MFTIYWTPGKKKPYCPKCGDGVAVKRNPYTTGKNPETVGTKPHWTEREKETLKLLYNTSNLTYAEIGVMLNKTTKAVSRMLERMRGNESKVRKQG